MHLSALSSLSLVVLLAGSLADCSPAQNNGLDWLRFVGGPLDDLVGFPNGIDITPNGDIWLAGIDSAAGPGNAQVTRLSSAGVLLSSWTFGGVGVDRANAIKVVGGLVHVAGRTDSANFPVVGNAVQAGHNGARDFFYTVLDANSGIILYSTCLGGSGDDIVTDLELDPNGDTWLYGCTTSANFPTTASAFQAGLSGPSDVVVARIDRTKPGSAGLRYSTLFGGTGSEPFANCSDLVVGASGVLTFAADTDSTDLPITANAWQPGLAGAPGDAFLARLDANGTGAAQLLYSTYAGGNEFDNGNAMWVDRDVVTISGFTRSTNLPVTANAPQPIKSVGNDAYVLQLDISRPPTQQLRFCTYLGGARSDGANDLAVDTAGHITITGVTGSSPFPTTPGSYLPALLPIPPSTNTSHSFVARIDPIQGRLLYLDDIGTDNPFGGTTATALRPDGLGGVVVVGRTDAPNLPVTLGPALSGTHDAWLAKLSLLPQGVARLGASSWTSGLAPSFVGVSGIPVRGDTTFALLTSGAPGTSQGGCGAPLGGLFIADMATPFGFQFAGIQVHLALPIVVSLPAASSSSQIPLSLAGIPIGARAAFQLAYAYPGCGLLHASNALGVRAD